MVFRMLHEPASGARMRRSPKSILKINNYFTREREAYSGISWEKRTAELPGDEKGEGHFRQEGVEFPSTWSQLATDIVAAKYFYGKRESHEREYSVRGMIDRVAGKMRAMAEEQDYLSAGEAAKFEEELRYAAIHQLAAFNSPVWFNVGLDRILSQAGKTKKGAARRGNWRYDSSKRKAVRLREGESYRYPQTSACFIQHVDDTMEDIMRLATSEAMLFKFGSGTGTNLSTLRSVREELSGGGTPSGPLSYLKVFDDSAGIIKSGGKTRRAAKMNILNHNHPDIKDFIEAKPKEEDKVRALVDAGYSLDEATATATYQNTNLSVRVTDEFMDAVETGGSYDTIAVTTGKPVEKLEARKIMDMIAHSAWKCGDPGIQFHTTINRWHTCPNSGAINASNPCSEYMFIDNSSCNLASLNLLRFLREDRTFDVAAFYSAIDNTILAQDILIDNSSYPEKKIAENSHKFRPLGLGYANLGAFLMNLALPYDSEKARATASAITSLMTARAYLASTELARTKGSFEEFQKNKAPMLAVLKRHRDATDRISRSHLPRALESLVDEAKKTWSRAISQAERYGIRNAQVSVLAPTGTISFMMDCDTTGIEPDTMLMKEKKLAGGGTLTIVNNSVGSALRKLGYSEEQASRIMQYIKERRTIEGCWEVNPEHLSVFDCGYKAKDKSGRVVGERCLSYNAHINMMAAVQPFISGAISKTVSLPEETTPAKIREVYLDAWKKGLKAVALYRDFSKASQVLGNREIKRRFKWGERKKLPANRELYGTAVSIFSEAGEIRVHFLTGEYEDGTPGEFFIGFGKSGNPHAAMYVEMGKDLSRRRQLGDSLEDIIADGLGTTGDVSGAIDHPYIKRCTSVKDLLMKILALQYLGNDEYCKVKLKPEDKSRLRVNVLKKREHLKKHEIEETAEANPTAIKSGTKVKCLNCGGWAERVGCKKACPHCGKEDQSTCAD